MDKDELDRQMKSFRKSDAFKQMQKEKMAEIDKRSLQRMGFNFAAMMAFVGAIALVGVVITFCSGR